MSDVANILGIKVSASTAEDAFKLLTEGKAKNVKKKITKPVGMARELFQLVGDKSIAPSIQPVKVSTPAFKTKRTNVSKGKWVWTTFNNSARLYVSILPY